MLARQVYKGLYNMLRREFKAAATAFLEAVATFTATEVAGRVCEALVRKSVLGLETMPFDKLKLVKLSWGEGEHCERFRRR